MAVGEIIIHRIWMNVQVGCYEISSKHFDINNFYMCIDRSTKIIKFFATENFDENPIRIVNYNNKNEKLGCIPGVPMVVFGIVLRQAFKVLKMDTFPDSLSYAA